MTYWKELVQDMINWQNFINTEMNPNWTSNYQILKRRGKTNHKVQNPSQGKQRTFRISLLIEMTMMRPRTTWGGGGYCCDSCTHPCCHRWQCLCGSCSFCQKSFKFTACQRFFRNCPSATRCWLKDKQFLLVQIFYLQYLIARTDVWQHKIIEVC